MLVTHRKASIDEIERAWQGDAETTSNSNLFFRQPDDCKPTVDLFFKEFVIECRFVLSCRLLLAGCRAGVTRPNGALNAGQAWIPGGGVVDGLGAGLYLSQYSLCLPSA